MLDLSWETLPAGVYKGTITEIDIHYGELNSLRPTYTIKHNGVDYFLTEFLPFDAPAKHPRKFDTARGKARIVGLLPGEQIKDYDDLIEKLIGLPVKVTVGVRVSDGLPVPKVSAVTLDKTDAKEKKIQPKQKAASNPFDEE